MMVGGPLLVAMVPGVLVIILTWWLRKSAFPFIVRLIPSLLTAVAALILFYIGFVQIRGFEGGAYALLAFFLLGFAFVSLIIGTQKARLHE
ncbi:hypothetical protein GCM10010954_36460 [Halobacillus andaensis]|uniref:YesK-like protein n=1 Tax=Halobacillus andaensis TaxID=1176239 RepID=A0A917EZL7_HALAA|nr:hypothetical protein [Halobacillus andaensis]MBP2006300.1 ABC-type Na+ efflux pump permease subunit [Halobacillus andaensis]GGF34106.1 hypothetical protein GCM10010954_36460 [Halobacillus andaensis]